MSRKRRSGPIGPPRRPDVLLIGFYCYPLDPAWFGATLAPAALSGCLPGSARQTSGFADGWVNYDLPPIVPVSTDWPWLGSGALSPVGGGLASPLGAGL